SKDPMFAGRFLREAKAASRIDHPNSLRVIDFGEEPDGVLYMAMEFLSGRDLFAVLGKSPMSSNERIVDLLAQVLAALAVAHDARSDLYSVGVILFQMLTGKVPFEANTALGIVLKHVTDDPPLPRSINPAVHPRLEAICMKALRKRQEERFQSAREMRGELKA